MNRFEKQLEKWNKGILRGAQARLAKLLQVSTATVALWTTGKRHPSKGYVAKMAQLFELDVYDVARLFSPDATYLDTYPAKRPFALYEGNNTSLTRRARPLSGQEAVISLPVFSKLPPHYPHRIPQEAATHWIVPHQDAKDARFLFRLPCQQDPERLLFIQPCAHWHNKALMLARNGQHYQLAHVQQAHGQLVLLSPAGGDISPQGLTPVGIVVRQVINVS